MSRWRLATDDDPVSAPEAPERVGDGGIAGYDAWRTATPPEYSDPPRARPTWADRMPAASCGFRWGTLCDLPADHWLRKEACNMNGWGGRAR
jgi:hypothetical protein